jgi:hypothetical protein
VKRAAITVARDDPLDRLVRSGLPGADQIPLWPSDETCEYCGVPASGALLPRAEKEVDLSDGAAPEMLTCNGNVECNPRALPHSRPRPRPALPRDPRAIRRPQVQRLARANAELAAEAAALRARAHLAPPALGSPAPAPPAPASPASSARAPPSAPDRRGGGTPTGRLLARAAGAVGRAATSRGPVSPGWGAAGGAGAREALAGLIEQLDGGHGPVVLLQLRGRSQVPLHADRRLRVGDSVAPLHAALTRASAVGGAGMRQRSLKPRQRLDLDCTHFC